LAVINGTTFPNCVGRGIIVKAAVDLAGNLRVDSFVDGVCCLQVCMFQGEWSVGSGKIRGQTTLAFAQIQISRVSMASQLSVIDN
jgi:hypothetical protein